MNAGLVLSSSSSSSSATAASSASTADLASRLGGRRRLVRVVHGHHRRRRRRSVELDVVVELLDVVLGLVVRGFCAALGRGLGGGRLRRLRGGAFAAVLAEAFVAAAAVCLRPSRCPSRPSERLVFVPRSHVSPFTGGDTPPRVPGRFRTLVRPLSSPRFRRKPRAKTVDNGSEHPVSHTCTTCAAGIRAPSIWRTYFARRTRSGSVGAHSGSGRRACRRRRYGPRSPRNRSSSAASFVGAGQIAGVDHRASRGVEPAM